MLGGVRPRRHESGVTPSSPQKEINRVCRCATCTVISLTIQATRPEMARPGADIPLNTRPPLSQPV